MVDYKLYCLDRRDKITKSEWIQADSDEEAVTAACVFAGDLDCELWVGTRKVARIDHGRARFLSESAAGHPR